MSDTLLRVPTRTKTQSFEGSQMDFKFPSIESLPNAKTDELELSNHYILNNTVNGSSSDTSRNNSKYSPNSNKLNGYSENDTSDAHSQIMSDYTSLSNPYSSNGYYSFANISDNTTSTNSKLYKNRKFVGSNVMSDQYIHNFNDNESFHGNNKQFRNTLAPARVASYEPSFFDKSSKIEPSHNENSTNKSNDNHHINNNMTLGTENVSYRIESSNSTNVSTRDSVAYKPHTEKLTRIPTIKKVNSSTSSTSLKSSKPTSYISSPSNKSFQKRPSQLKRSNAVRCKGGLLQFFTMLALKFKKQFAKLALVLKRKVFSFKDKNRRISNKSSRITRSSTFNSELNIKNKKLKKSKDIKDSDSNINIQLTSHIQRTNKGNKSKLNDSKSHKYLEPVLVKGSKFENVPINKPLNKSTTAESNKITSAHTNLNTKTTSLRRTPSSIKRAASVFTTSSVSSKIMNNTFMSRSSSKNGNIIEQDSNSILSKIRENNGAQRSSSRLTRSTGLNSLNSLVREPSIVVRNKVIPLTMTHYPIKEETEDEDSGKSEHKFCSDENDEYIIDTKNGMHTIKQSLLLNDSDSFLDDSDSDLFDETEFMSLNDDNYSIKSDVSEDHKTSAAKDEAFTEVENVFNDYFSKVIYQRIKLRVQVSKFQQSAASMPTKSPTSKLPTIEEDLVSSNKSSTLLTRNDDNDVTVSNEPKSQDYNTDIDSMIQRFNVSQSCTLENDTTTKNYNNSVNITIQSPFKNNAHSSSVISFHTKDVHRSLTLPISIKI